MTDERDRELARRLDELEPPPHRASFWSDLRTANSTLMASESDAHLVENEQDDDSTRTASDSDAHFVENEARLGMLTT